MRGRGFRGCCVGWLIGGLLGLAVLSGLVVLIRKRRARPSADDTLVADLLGPPELPEAPVPQTWSDGPRSPAPRARQEGQPARAPRARKDRWPPRAAGRPAPDPLSREDDQSSRAPDQPPRDPDQLSPVPEAREDDPPSRAPRQPRRARRQASPASQARKDDRPSPAAGQSSPAAGQSSAAAPPSAALGPPSAAPQAQRDGQPPPAPSAPQAGGEDWLETQLAWINAWSQQMKEQIASTEQSGSHGKE